MERRSKLALAPWRLRLVCEAPGLDPGAGQEQGLRRPALASHPPLPGNNRSAAT